MRDLGKYFDCSVSFCEHYGHIIINKGSWMLGLLCTTYSDLNNPIPLKSLYYSFIHSVSECDFVI